MFLSSVSYSRMICIRILLVMHHLFQQRIGCQVKRPFQYWSVWPSSVSFFRHAIIFYNALPQQILFINSCYPLIPVSNFRFFIWACIIKFMKLHYILNLDDFCWRWFGGQFEVIHQYFWLVMSLFEVAVRPSVAQSRKVSNWLPCFQFAVIKVV